MHVLLGTFGEIRLLSPRHLLFGLQSGVSFWELCGASLQVHRLEGQCGSCDSRQIAHSSNRKDLPALRRSTGVRSEAFLRHLSTKELRQISLKATETSSMFA